MTSAFAVVIILVAVAGLVAGLTCFSPFGAAHELGRTGSSWFDHADDHGLADAPDPGENDPPIPQRPLRGRP